MVNYLNRTEHEGRRKNRTRENIVSKGKGTEVKTEVTFYAIFFTQKEKQHSASTYKNGLLKAICLYHGNEMRP